MKAAQVIGKVIDASIWENAIWVNHQLKVFFVPIWRCGNTTFMTDVAPKLNFELVKDANIDGYYGIAFIRNPHKRLPSQIWMVHKNRGLAIQSLIENLNNQVPLDEHFIKQIDFLTGKYISCYIDIDNLKYDYGNSVANEIVEIMHTQRRNSVDDASRRIISDTIANPDNFDIVQAYIIPDLEMWEKNTK